MILQKRVFASRFPLQLAMLFAISLGLVLMGRDAHADPRRVYTITDIPVDETAETTIQAQENAFAAARLIATQRLIEKITLPEDRGAAGGIPVTLELANRLSAAVDIVEEARGGGRYVGKLSVVLNPRMVREHLTSLGVPFVDAQAPLALLVMQEGSPLVGAMPEEDLNAIAPYRIAVIPQTPDANLNYAALQTQRGAERVILVQSTGGSEQLTLWTPTGAFSYGATLPGGLPAQRAEALRRALDRTWKEQSIVRSATRTLVQADVRYTSIAEWVSLRESLARSPLVSQFRIIGLARDGAVVNFAFAGDAERLRGDLLQRGVELVQDPSGWIMRTASYQPRTVRDTPANGTENRLNDIGRN